jgi:glycosyltransferase involved in cell wall biosynthesis
LAKTTPHLSILIPTLDEASWITHSVRSARASLQAAEIDGEIVVCDGGSRDNTVAQARRWADRVLDGPPGRAAQLNAAASVATGEVLVMLHADALLDPDAIRGVVDAIESGADGGWFQIEILPELQRLGAVYALRLMAWGINHRTRLFRTATADQCIFCRRMVFDSIGGLPDVVLMEGNLFARSMRTQAKRTQAKRDQAKRDQATIEILGPHLRISGRRWEKNGVFRTMFLMYGIRAGHRAGISTEVLDKVWRQLSE